jgi:hypothetical protein
LNQIDVGFSEGFLWGDPLTIAGVDLGHASYRFVERK